MAVAVTVVAGCGSSDDKKSGAATPPKNGLIALRVHTGVVNYQIFTVAEDGSGLRQLTHLPADQAADGPEAPAWGPRGDRLAFDAGDDHGASIYTVRADGSGLTRLHGLGKFVYQPSFSPDAKQLAYSRDGGPRSSTPRQGIYVANSNGQGGHRVTRAPSSKQGGDFAVQWSPDGTRLVFIRELSDNKQAVFVVATDGRSLKRITPYGPLVNSPDWSPDGTEIVFVRGAPEGNTNLYTVHPDGTGIRALTHYTGASGGLGYHASWSPDGKRIAFSKSDRFDSAGQAWTIKADGSDPQLVTRGPDSGVLTPEWGSAG